jgi:hypothetical protein
VGWLRQTEPVRLGGEPEQRLDDGKTLPLDPAYEIASLKRRVAELERIVQMLDTRTVDSIRFG